jgi:hypothetical protein
MLQKVAYFILAFLIVEFLWKNLFSLLLFQHINTTSRSPTMTKRILPGKVEAN